MSAVHFQQLIKHVNKNDNEMWIVPATQKAKKGRHGVHSTQECSETITNKLRDAYSNIKDIEYSKKIYGCVKESYAKK